MIITIEITDEDVRLLAHEMLVSPTEWVTSALRGRINKSKSQLIADELPKLLADPLINSIPATEEGLVETILNRQAYRNRAQREEA